MLKSIEWILFSSKCEREGETEGKRKKREGKRE